MNNKRFQTGSPYALYNGTVAKGDCIYLDKVSGNGNTPLAFFAYDLNIEPDDVFVEDVNDEFVTIKLADIKMIMPMKKFVELLTPINNEHQ